MRVKGVTMLARPKKYTEKSLRKAVNAYFQGITRTVTLREQVNTGKKDGWGHWVYELRDIKNDAGEPVKVRQFATPPTVGGLCEALGIHRSTWAEYCKREKYPELAETTEWAREIIQNYLESELLIRDGKNLKGVIFSLENNFRKNAMGLSAGSGGSGNDEKPFEIPGRLIAPSLLPVHLDILDHDHMEYVEKGGRGSTKSSFISLEIVSLIKNNPMMHALCCRKVGNTLRGSVYAQIKWAINALGLEEEFESTESRIEITYKPTGQKIYFRGADDPIKLKSIKTEFGYIGILWLEELDQFAGDKECRNIQQSAIRGGDEAYIFKSFNPPITRDNWANKYCEQEKKNRLVTHTDYRTVPKKWLGKAFLEKAEELRETDETAYRHEYLGEATGTGGNVFEKLELREITDREIASFDRIYQGVDFGWIDPFAFIRLHYDRDIETIFLLDEIYKRKLSNEEAAREIKEKGYTDAYITCDNAEPKSIADLRACGLPAKEAIKGPGSVDYGMKWLQKRKIVIDIRRTPRAYQEFVNYEYDRDKDGEIISGYPDCNNHSIDAVRYALERVFRRMGVTA